MKKENFSYFHSAFCVVSSILLFLNYYFGNDYISLVITVITISQILVCKEETCLPIMLYYSSFAYLYRFNAYALYEFICLAFIMRICLCNKQRLNSLIVISTLYLFTHLLSTNIFKLNIGIITPFIVIICIYASCLVYHKSQKSNCIDYFILGHIVSSLIGFLKKGTRLALILEDDYISNSSWWDTTRYSGLTFDANYYTLITIISLCYLVMVAKKNMEFTKWLIATVFLIVTGALTYSKSFYLTLVCLVVFSFISAEKETRKKMYKLIPIALLCCFIFREKISSVTDLFLKRFDNTDLTSGRSDLWNAYLPVIFENVTGFLFGHGVIGYGVSTSKGIKAAHNTYIELLYKFGLIGTLTDIWYWIMCSKTIKKYSRFSFRNIIIYLIFAILIFNLSAYSFLGIWACIIMCYLYTSENIENTEGEN